MQNPYYYNTSPNIDTPIIQPPTIVRISRNRQDLYLSGDRDRPVPIIGVAENPDMARMISEYNLEPIESLEFDRVVDNEIRTFKVMMSREFEIGEGRVARIAYTLVTETYGNNKRQRVVPILMVSSNSHVLWRAVPAINYDRYNGFNITKSSEDFTEHDLNLPHELQKYLLEREQRSSEDINDTPRSMSDRLRRFLRRTCEKNIDFEKLAKIFAMETREEYNPRGFAQLRIGINKERLKPEIDSMVAEINNSGKVISEYKTKNKLYGHIEAKVVKAGDFIITFFNTKHGIFVGNIECSNSDIIGRYCVNSTAVSGIEEALAPLINYAAEVNQDEDENPVGGGYVVVSYRNTPEIAKMVRSAGERFFRPQNHRSATRRGWAEEEVFTPNSLCSIEGYDKLKRTTNTRSKERDWPRENFTAYKLLKDGVKNLEKIF